jgi:hypothetical protein
VVTGTHKFKPGLHLVLALTAMVAAFAVPTQAMANENCSNAGNDPTAAQYCSVAGVQGNGGEGNNSGPSGGENKPAAAEEPVVEAVESEGSTASPAESTASPAESGTLPFTGLDLGILAVAAAALVGTGLLLRRLTASGVPRS